MSDTVITVEEGLRAAAAAEIAPGVISTPESLQIVGELAFNDWRRLGERLEWTLDRALWSLGDWWLYGERFSKDYGAGWDDLKERLHEAKPAGTVAKVFPPERRRRLPFAIHKLLTPASLASERERWLDEVERHAWIWVDLRQALEEAKVARRQAELEKAGTS